MTPGATVTFELSGLFEQKTFVGFLFAASDGSLAPASANAVSYPACAPAVYNGDDEAAKTAAMADWTLPTTPGIYQLSIYALEDSSTWWACTYEYEVVSNNDDEEGVPMIGPTIALVVGFLCTRLL